ncbi:XRE family transcriptional regulator [Rhodopseudomonas palustris]|uniref:XRE family transcriptional regulator n=1 Tax=Rhodopseudomonas palustris TaxID=1076 RepID=A0AAX3E1Y1_RHOPL|nr:XRE family transcriptional regulator [Rhodopseudomonas palustris]UYO41003.1 XRE family transcriptional regulator [Rhodopseudomonas palustris]
MIKNERQYKLTRSQAQKFETALKNFSELALLRDGFNPILIKAQRDALESQLKSLNAEISTYEALKHGRIRTLSTSDISELGKKFIEARIAQNLTQKELAIRLGMKEQQVQRYEKEHYASASLERVVEIADALGITTQLQLTFDKPNERYSPSPLPSETLSKLPVKEIRARGWLRSINPNITKANLASVLEAFIEPAFSKTGTSLLRQGKRKNADLDEHALLAWKARVIWRARAEKPKEAPNFRDLSWLKTFKEFTGQERGPALAVEYLKQKGILVLFERHLPKTHLDGAALLVDDRILTIALTLRHDRLDNFWFVLLHELGHIIQHRDSGLRQGFFDEDEAQPVDKLEREADEFAKNTLLPTELWLSSLIRFTQSSEQIVEFAKENRISAAIVAGWIRRERSDYSIFSDLIGQGKVKSTLREAGLLEITDASDK